MSKTGQTFESTGSLEGVYRGASAPGNSSPNPTGPATVNRSGCASESSPTVNLSSRTSKAYASSYGILAGPEPVNCGMPDGPNLFPSSSARTPRKSALSRPPPSEWHPNPCQVPRVDSTAFSASYGKASENVAGVQVLPTSCQPLSLDVPGSPRPGSSASRQCSSPAKP